MKFRIEVEIFCDPKEIEEQIKKQVKEGKFKFISLKC